MGIVMIQNLTGHLVPLSEYINRDYLSLKSPYNIDEQNMRDLDAQRYTNVTDLNAVMRFSRLPEANDGQLMVRYSRELHMEDLKDANVILLGSSFSNPWAELFEKNLNFEFSYQPHPNASLIVNRHPQAGELPVYQNDATGPSHRTYAVIALVPNLNNTGWVLSGGRTDHGRNPGGGGHSLQPRRDAPAARAVQQCATVLLTHSRS